MSSESSDDIEKPKSRMTVTKLGHKIDDLADVLDIMHNEIQQLQTVCKGLVEIQKELLDLKKNSSSDKEKPPKDSGFKGMFG